MLALLGWVGVAAHWGVNISNASPEYLQPERVISGSYNYPPGYLPSDPTSLLSGFPFHSGLPKGLAFHSLAWFPVNCQLSIPPSHFHHLCRPVTVSLGVLLYRHVHVVVLSGYNNVLQYLLNKLIMCLYLNAFLENGICI